MLKGHKPVFRVNNRFKIARKAAGLTQVQMSKQYGIPLKSIQNWEGDQSEPPAWAERFLMEKLQQLADERQEKVADSKQN